MQKRSIFIGGLLLLIIFFGGLFLFSEKSDVQPEKISQNQESNSVENKQNKETEETNPEITQTPNKALLGTQDLWNVFSLYLQAAQSQNRDALKSLSYFLSDVCKATPVSQECKDRMISAYEAGKNLAQKDFTILWVDDRQAILSTAPQEVETAQGVGFSWSVLFFAKNEEGTFGILAFDPKRTFLLKKNATTSKEVLQENARKYMADSDRDGISDNFENCVFPDNLIILSECTKTNPNLRDTDGDLWWDGIDVYTKLFE